MLMPKITDPCFFYFSSVQIKSMYWFNTNISNSIMRTGIFGGDRIFTAGVVTMDPNNLARVSVSIAMAYLTFSP